MLKFIGFMSFVLVAAAYEDIDDNYDYNKLLQNKTLLNEYFGCLVDRNPCSEIATHIKAHLKEITHDACAECNDVQRHYAHLFLDAMKKDFPDVYEQYKKMYSKGETEVAKLKKTLDPY